MSILVFGELRWDVIARGPLPAPGRPASAEALGGRPGGAGAQIALAAAEAGGSVALAGAVGADDAGRRLRGALLRAGIGLDEVERLDMPTGQGVGIEAPDGVRLLAVEGANGRARGDGVRLPPSLAVFVLANRLGEDANLALARRVPRQATCILCLLDEVPSERTFKRMDVVVASEADARTATGAAPGAEARALAARGPVAVVLDVDDARLARRGGEDLAFPGRGGDPADFTGRLAAALARGLDLDEAVGAALRPPRPDRPAP